MIFNCFNAKKLKNFIKFTENHLKYTDYEYRCY